MSLERKVITECILLYRDFPCLWDSRQVLYNNKEARDQAYEVILEKYKQLEEDATVLDLKKRIENMRSCYRREHKKVLLSRLRGDDPEHSPHLWYYDLLSFLKDVMEFGRLEVQEPHGENIMSKLISHPGPVKIEFQDCNSSKGTKKRKLSSYFMQEQDSQDSDEYESNTDCDTSLLNQDSNHVSHTTLNLNTVTESDAFGTTVGLQLKELNPLQRIYAEKLISDIIFNARLNKLSVDSTVDV